MPDGAGKGDKPRNCFSKDFKNNYDLIVWRKPKKIKETKDENEKNSDQICSDK
jgi:hypothetical protein